jgi:ribonuclease J
MLRIVPLGGLGEIGLNAMVFEADGERLLVDAGLMFPTAEMPGVDIVVPDFSFLRERPSALQGIVLTHGHEDHVGALASLLEQVSAPVYGTPFTLALVRARLEEHGVTADLREVAPRHRFRVGQAFEVEPLAVSHSIADGMGLAVTTRAGTVVHTGDFKVDLDPVDGRATDLARLGELGDRGVLGLLSDSTNAEAEGRTTSERVVAQTLEALIRGARARVVVALFASNLPRLRQLFAIAEATGRQVALHGRSLLRNAEIARAQGYLPVKSPSWVSAEEARGLSPEKVLLVTTGAQAEPRSGLVSLLAPEGPGLSASDLVVLSSRAIPGNERAVGELINRLYARGCEVAYARTHPNVHASGHASRDELREVIEHVRPRCFVPIHGEERMLRHHLRLAHQTGVEERGLLLAHDGDVLELTAEGIRHAGTVPCGRVLKDRFGAGEVDALGLKDREKLGGAGVVVAAVAIDAARGLLLKGPTLLGRGLSLDEQAQLARAEQDARALFLELSPALYGDDAMVREALEQAARRALKALTAKRPNVVPVVVRL